MRLFLAPALMAATCFGQPFGTWRSGHLTVRIEPHPKGEVFTLDRTEPDGRTTSSSTILYFDGRARDLQDFGCSGTQSSRRVDSTTVEILRQCGLGEWTRFLRRNLGKQKELVLEMTEQHADGSRIERRITLERQFKEER